MAIKITKVAHKLYTATLSVPDVPGVSAPWSTEQPLNAEELINELMKRGAHQTDVGDAFYAADPDWLAK